MQLTHFGHKPLTLTRPIGCLANEILNAARNELQHWYTSGSAVHSSGPSNRYYSAMRQVSHSVICSEAVGRRDTAMVLRFMAWSYGVSARDLAPTPVVISVGH